MQSSRNQLIEVGRELRVARLMSGKRQVDVGRSARITAAHVSRIERGRAPGVTHRTLAAMSAAVGIRLWIRAYPIGRRLLDAPQLELFSRFTARTGGSWE
jgi:transcriptional regulator with XRE-family HTH domain